MTTLVEHNDGSFIVGISGTYILQIFEFEFIRVTIFPGKWIKSGFDNDYGSLKFAF